MKPALLRAMVVTTQPNINYVQIGGNYIPLPPVKEQAAIADIYSLMADYQVEVRIEQDAWAKLRGLAGLTSLSEARDASLSDALQQARYSQWLLNIDSKQAQDAAKRIGIRGTPVPYSLSPLCIATDVTRTDALKRLGSKYGEPL